MPRTTAAVSQPSLEERPPIPPPPKAPAATASSGPSRGRPPSSRGPGASSSPAAIPRVRSIRGQWTADAARGLGAGMLKGCHPLPTTHYPTH